MFFLFLFFVFIFFHSATGPLQRYSDSSMVKSSSQANPATLRLHVRLTDHSDRDTAIEPSNSPIIWSIDRLRSSGIRSALRREEDNQPDREKKKVTIMLPPEDQIFRCFPTKWTRVEAFEGGEGDVYRREIAHPQSKYAYRFYIHGNVAFALKRDKCHLHQYYSQSSS